MFWKWQLLASLVLSISLFHRLTLTPRFGATFFPTRGLMAGLAYERFQSDLSVSGTGRNALDVEANFFPWAHFELVGFARYQFFGPGSASNEATASLFMLQLHYYL